MKAPAPAPPTAEECLACHADKDLRRSAPVKGRPDSLFVDEAVLKASPHAPLDCVGCHQGATAPHERLARVACEGCHVREREALGEGVHGSRAARTAATPATCAGCHGTHDVRPAMTLGSEACAGCHARQVERYREGIHGAARAKGDGEAATCRSCHGRTHTALGRTDPRAPTYHLNLPRTCAQCHGDPELARRHNIRVGNVYQLYMDSIHGRAVSKSGLLVSANCSDCHGAHEIKPPTDPTSRVFRANIPQTCATCHAGIHREYVESVHGRAMAAGSGVAPVCTDCHSAHQIQRVEGAPWQLEVARECGTCHRESGQTYRDTFHGKAATLGLARAAKCLDCHGSHFIQPAADPRSMVSAANLVVTCRRCHPAATQAFTQYHPHADPHDRARFPKLYWVTLLMVGLLTGTFAFFGLHTLLWFPRSLIERLRGHGEETARPGAPSPTGGKEARP